jgi:serine/threonine protein phosphatase PrpC
MMNPTTETAPLTLRWFGRTDRGRVRKNNEDAFLALQFDAREVHYLGKIGEASVEHIDLVFAVSDGMGGAHAGEFASRIAVDKITHLLPRSFKQSVVGLEAGFGDVLGELFAEIHSALTYLGSSDPDCAGMGATLSLCWFTPAWMYFAHVGDSRIYYFPARGGMKQLSHDDTHVGWLFRNGKLTEREARDHRARNSLQKALGAGHQFIDPQLGAVGLESGDRFLLCTDGLIDGLFDAQILELVRPMERQGPDWNPASALVDATLERAGRDNTTAVVVEVR